MITSADNEKLKTIRKLQQKRWRTKLGLFSAEGEDLVGPDPEFILRSGVDVEPELLDAVSTLGSGTRVIGVYRQRWSEPAGDVLVYLHGVEDPGNVGTIIRSAHALADATVVLGPGCADPYSPKAVRASMGSIFTHPPARATLDDLDGRKVALDAKADRDLREIDVTSPVVLVMGSERGGLPEGVERARIPVHADSLNVAMAATVGLYETALRMADDG
ncbi:MAG TPA: RNA methyltransferase [Thermoleophilaceae bacterium]|nr:RNA methyltransferase [Thermoleophilaceae bacterium]